MSTLGKAQISPSRDGTYQPDPCGQWAAITGVHDRHGELVDLVAWRPDEPGQWWLRVGDETPFLGTRRLAMAAYYHDTITLHPNPQDWLLAGREGVCVLKWSWRLDDLFEGVRVVECSNVPLQRKLISTIRKWEPRVVVRREVIHAD